MMQTMLHQLENDTARRSLGSWYRSHQSHLRLALEATLATVNSDRELDRNNELDRTGGELLLVMDQLQAVKASAAVSNREAAESHAALDQARYNAEQESQQRGSELDAAHGELLNTRRELEEFQAHAREASQATETADEARGQADTELSKARFVSQMASKRHLETVQGLEKEIQAQRKQIGTLREESAGRDTQFEKARHAEESAGKRHLQEVAQLKNEVEHAKDEVRRLTAAVGKERHGALDTAKEASDKSRLEAGRIQSELNRVRFEAEVDSTELVSCKKNLASAQATVEELRLELLEASKTTQKALRTAAAASKFEFEKAVLEREQARGMARDACSRMEDEIEAHRRSQEQDAAKTGMAAELVRQKHAQELEASRLQLQRLQNDHDRSTAASDAVASSLTRSEASLSTVQSSLEQAEASIAKQKVAVDGLTSKLQGAETEAGEACREAGKLQAEARVLRDSKLELEIRVMKLTSSSQSHGQTLTQACERAQVEHDTAMQKAHLASQHSIRQLEIRLEEALYELEGEKRARHASAQQAAVALEELGCHKGRVEFETGIILEAMAVEREDFNTRLDMAREEVDVAEAAVAYALTLFERCLNAV